MLTLDSKVSEVKGIGKALSEKLEKIGFSKVSDFLFHVPKKYIRYKSPKISEIKIGEKIKFRTKVLSWNKKFSKSGKRIIEGIFNVCEETLKVTFFNQEYLIKTFPEGTEVELFGEFRDSKFGMVFYNPKIRKIPEKELNQEIFPIYEEVSGFSSRFFSKVIFFAIQNLEKKKNPNMEILAKYGVLSLEDSLEKIHFPKSLEDIRMAKKSLAILELVEFFQKIEEKKKKLRNFPSYKMTLEKNDFQEFQEKLPFLLTNEQKKVLKEISKDFEKETFTKRLILGDTGSGKTIVSFFGVFLCAKNKKDSALISPSLILAKQHFKNAKEIFKDSGIKIIFISSEKKLIFDTTKKEEKDLSGIDIRKTENPKFFISTQAIFFEDLDFSNLGVLIVDEEQKFGVRQRKKILKKSFESSGKFPKFLSLSATPIPRTLSLPIFSDFEISIIEKRPFEPDIETKVFQKDEFEKVIQATRENISQGKPVVVVYPAILNSENSIEKREKFWKENFPGKRIEKIFGSLDDEKKEKIVEDFSKEKIDILLSSTVLELGVDLPNLSFLIVENAESFGFSTLHQIRGRVGRRGQKSTVILVANSKKGFEKIKKLERIKDGFSISEEDLKERGPGEFLGVLQSGRDKFLFANILNQRLVKEAKEIFLECTKIQMF